MARKRKKGVLRSLKGLKMKPIDLRLRSRR